MHEFLVNLAYLGNRYCHIVAMALLLGGTLFYEMVVPLAIGDLKTEHQLGVFARARWVFKSIVVSCALVLLVSGLLSTYRNWESYSGHEAVVLGRVVTLPNPAAPRQPPNLSLLQQPRTWFALHAAFGTIALLIAVSLVWGDRPPDRPIRWMRLNLLLLLITVFVASAARNARLRLLETADDPPTPTKPTNG